jgi:hypothetical protein
MGELFWTPRLDDWQSAVDHLNDMDWHLWTGEKRPFVGDTEGEFQAFPWGMAVSFTALPDSILEQIK